MKNCYFIYFTLIVCISKSAYSAKILCIFPVPYYSHNKLLEALTEDLIEQGHTLVIMTTKLRKNLPRNVTEIDVNSISSTIIDKTLSELLQKNQKFSTDNFSFWQKKFATGRRLLSAQLSSQQMQILISDDSEEFDLILIDGTFRTGLMITTRFKAPVVLVNSLGALSENFEAVGAETNFLFYPDFTISKILHTFFFERILETFKYLKMKWLFSSSKTEDNIAIRKLFGEHAPTIKEMQRNIKMLFLNVDRMWDHNRPTTLPVVYTGPFHLKKPNPVPADLQSYLDNSKNGVVYFTLGSKLRTSELPQNTLNVLKNVFASLPYDILWKWEKDAMPNMPENVRIEKWLPQNDILHHPKIKVFITHGGLHSTDEAIAANVPVIGLPVYGDQMYNVQLYEKFHIGTWLDIDQLDETEFRTVVIKVAEDKRCRENIRRLSRAIAEHRARSGVRAASYWVQHLTTYGDSHLRSPLADTTTLEYYLIDVLVITIISLVSFFVAIKYVSKNMYRKLFLKEV